ncbi:hypothetical protein EVG20_g7421 [Dentipellis fragilis]|uniref:RING-type domain-containing protein n=1 Tax=Dentipellis fragilis TaxID=205917 RepID=A0A4Y9YFE8_9AGAM|nr:hypothetical protein EVG20_g7421 [Dentipellis fragilis]
MHTLFSRRSRMEAARIADDTNGSGNGNGTTPGGGIGDGDVEGFSHAIALLRADGMSQERQQQLITRFQRERSEERRRTAMQWGDIEGEHDAPLPPVPRMESQMRRRFGPLPPLSSVEPGTGSGPGAEGSEPPSARHRRGVAAARFRLPSLRNATRPDLPSARERVERIIARTAARESTRYGMRRSPGDFMRDEDFDASYEALISLASTLGDVKPRCTPDHVINSLATGTYQDWANADSDQRCPICLDDYAPADAVTKLSDCPHWLHTECLEVCLHSLRAMQFTTNALFCLQQWLRSATTCPVCRHHVRGPRRESEGPVASSSGSGAGSGSAGPSGPRTVQGIDLSSVPVIDLDLDTDEEEEEMPLSFSDWRFD